MESLSSKAKRGSGSTFYFTVHFDLAPEQERHIARPTTSLRDLRVLVVDDNQTNLRILTEILHHWHMQPTAVASGQEALGGAGSKLPIVAGLMRWCCSMRKCLKWTVSR